MKTSILIIAHNEEAHIRECIESVLHQSQKADEIILMAHNCTDKTVNIAEEYSEVTLHTLETSYKGPQYARKYGFEKTTGEIIVCIDGDGVAKHDWLMEITKPFKNKNIIAPVLLDLQSRSCASKDIVPNSGGKTLTCNVAVFRTC